MRRKDKQREAPAAAPAEPKRLTPVEIQQKEFRLAVRGYNMHDVDQFLDEVTEEVARVHAENRRLIEDASFTRTSRLDVAAAEEADTIVRTARQEAARILAEARGRSGGAGPDQGAPSTSPAFPAGPPVDIRRLLARERAFLQNLASLIQAHAEGVKDDVRRIQPLPAEAPPSGESTPPSDQPEATSVPPAIPAAPAAPVATTPIEDEPTGVWSPPAGRWDDEEAPETADRAPETADTVERDDSEGSAVLADAPARSAGRPVDRDDHLVDLTAEESPLEAGQAHAVRPASASPHGDAADGPEEPSIRELFWGEE